MNRQEAIRILKKELEVTKDISKRFGDFPEHREALEMAIKALAQEPILDKIRAELHATAEMHEDGDYYLRDEWIDEYFDKYKAETEAEDGFNKT